MQIGLMLVLLEIFLLLNIWLSLVVVVVVRL
jgi:hypothetical protein